MGYEFEQLVKIDLQKNGLRRVINNEDEAHEALAALYALVWAEAKYDPTNDSTQEFALKLWPLITRANELLGFKK